MTDLTVLNTQLQQHFPDALLSLTLKLDEITIEVAKDHLLSVCDTLKKENIFDFNMLVDVCGIDYLHYGLDEWQTRSATATGFSRGVTPFHQAIEPSASEQASQHTHGTYRFAVIYHLLSLTHYHRLRIRVPLFEHEDLIVDSVTNIWPSANWFEREAFDLYGIIFRGHEDLRRILTDYGFSGHPFRKDFPLIGRVESRYDANLKRVIYEPVSIEPRVLEPKVIRHDHRYFNENKE